MSIKNVDYSMWILSILLGFNVKLLCLTEKKFNDNYGKNREDAVF